MFRNIIDKYLVQAWAVSKIITLPKSLSFSIGSEHTHVSLQNVAWDIINLKFKGSRKS